MDSLELQDVFEPYYAERKRFTARKGKRALAESDTGLASRTATALPTNVRLSDNKPDSTTEH
ncbi:hypothetical protein NKH47_02285 [Mesorhizobium sp. M1060]|uniref:hypothetical protein n=1 Tax=unclassified Mesorhizobium TaxID=325217 RepID=UPI0003CDE7D1|nr:MULTISPECIES: hypothetical protein [unclassified Mesorhizobium]ESW77177.1 hypothetical protein X773_24150 [Mesorhizobium sp. LSJC285A00]ESX61528.1 hypothetical protein X760_07650 [Mesorhizobium sp. LSHC422A00]ESY15994.1 hypothetical protein X750_26605 [Mesorhizobium sp. LNJC394B00]ESY17788.1 hypothetical protein X751_16710 [Mesorhizobium sp. LNJC395A00]ESZ05178.1 hypothetical protein X736_19145 [Mesorhizobium sp. L2C089B000]